MLEASGPGKSAAASTAESPVEAMQGISSSVGL